MKILITAIVFVLVTIIAIYSRNGIARKKAEKKAAHEAYMNEPVLHKYGKDDIFIKRNEVDHFEGLSRNEKRRLVARFQSQVKKGVFVRVYENNKVVGYVRSTK